jgi:hypothetical protein
VDVAVSSRLNILVPSANWVCDFKTCSKLSKNTLTFVLLKDLDLDKLDPSGDQRVSRGFLDIKFMNQSMPAI